MVFLQVLHILHFIGSQVVDNLGIIEKIQNLPASLLQALQSLQHNLPLFREFLRNIVGVVDFFVQGANKVRHICGFKQVVLALDHLLVRKRLIAIEELEKRKDQVPIEIGNQFWRKVVFLHELCCVNERGFGSHVQSYRCRRFGGRRSDAGGKKWLVWGLDEIGRGGDFNFDDLTVFLAGPVRVA